MQRKLHTLFAMGFLMVAVTVGLSARTAGAADHLDAPLVAEDGRIDINDIYAFQSPSNPDNSVLIMTVNPLAGVLSPTSFHPKAKYRFLIDNDGDFRSDVEIDIDFDELEDGMQEVEIEIEGDDSDVEIEAEGDTGETISIEGGGTLHAGLFDDPFFFDLVAFLDQVKGAGGTRTFCDGMEVDFFAGANVSAIVLELPSALLTEGGDSTVRVWATTKLKNTKERMGIPALNTVLIPDGSEDAFNATKPKQDVARWSADVEASLLFLSGLDGTGYTADEAAFIASLLLPDVLTLDTASAGGFVPGLNGRQLPEDVIDFELFVVTGGLGANGTPVLTSDCVDANDVPFANSFPYLAPAHP